MDTAYAKTESPMYTSELDDCIIEFVNDSLHTLQHKYQISFDVDYSVLYIDHENFVGTVPYKFLQMMKRREKKTVPTEIFHDDLGWLQSFCKLR